MAVEQEVLAWLALITRYDRRLDNTHFTYRGSDLSVFGGFPDCLGNELERLDISDRNAQALSLKGHFHQ